MSVRKVVKREFLGNLFPVKDKNFHKAHLTAYLKGWENFRHGFDNNGKANWFKVQKKEYYA